MTCHGSRAGSGSVSIVGAPATYGFNEVYDLTVRVADPDQVGAGFQLSVEDAGGIHVGALTITDPIRTQPAPINPEWVTHTAAGVDNAVANWAALGNAAEYTVQWRSPATDIGPITFFAAGNAINNDFQAFTGLDIIYLTSVSATAGATCSDGVHNNGEDGVDCGGPCPACECLADADCDDGDSCTQDTCVMNACANDRIAACCLADADCDDGNDCTLDQCLNNDCVNDVISGCCHSDGTCDDGLFCNGPELCVSGMCEPGIDPCAGQSCIEGARSCGECAADDECDDGNPCTDDMCDGNTCANVDNEVVCDDGDPCTDADRCESGECIGAHLEDCCTADDACDDDDECTTDVCEMNLCVHQAITGCGGPDGTGDTGDTNDMGTGSDPPLDDGNDGGTRPDGDGSSPAARSSPCGLFGMITMPMIGIGLMGLGIQSRTRRAAGRGCRA